MLKKFATIMTTGLVLFIIGTAIGDAYLWFQYEVCRRLITNRTTNILECIIIVIVFIGMWLMALYLHVKEQNEESTNDEVIEG